jgi:hypothetical protein
VRIVQLGPGQKYWREKKHTEDWIKGSTRLQELLTTHMAIKKERKSKPKIIIIANLKYKSQSQKNKNWHDKNLKDLT